MVYFLSLLYGGSPGSAHQDEGRLGVLLMLQQIEETVGKLFLGDTQITIGVAHILILVLKVCHRHIVDGPYLSGMGQYLFPDDGAVGIGDETGGS